MKKETLEGILGRVMNARNNGTVDAAQMAVNELTQLDNPWARGWIQSIGENCLSVNKFVRALEGLLMTYPAA